MARASIPVDLFNPGQVFASLGFLEAAEALCGCASGGFDWSGEAEARFVLAADTTRNPFEVVLEFMANAHIDRLAPGGYQDAVAKGEEETVSKGEKKKRRSKTAQAVGGSQLIKVDTFPARKADAKTLPVRLESNSRNVDISHWCDGSSRYDFKLFAGQQSAPVIVRELVDGGKRHATRGIADLWGTDFQRLARDPFVAVPMGGSTFKFDARKAWTGLDAGYSPDDQGHAVTASPVVELLAAVGLEHARPVEYDTRRVRYAVWGEPLPPCLARAAFAGARFGVPLRCFRFELQLSGKNKVVTFAQEEVTS